MTTLEMIIRCRMLLQRVNSNVYQSILTEEWEDMINMTIDEYVRKHSFDPQDSNRDNYEIINSSEGLQTLIRTIKVEYPSKYLNFTDGYYVNLASLGNILNAGYISHVPIKSGFLYRIVKLYGADTFVSVGATNNVNGELFTANFTASASPTLLASGDGTILSYNGDKYTTHTTSNLRAGISYNVGLGTVTFAVGYALKITADGVDYWLAGANQNRATNLILSAGSTFVIHDEYSAQWADYSILEELGASEVFFKYISSKTDIEYDCKGVTTLRKDAGNRIIKVKDLEDFRRTNRSMQISSPLCILHNNNLVVFSNESLDVPVDKIFTIRNIILTYYKRPNRVSVTSNINCDLDEIVHEEIVRKTVDSMVAAISSPNYQAMKSETMSNTQPK